MNDSQIYAAFCGTGKSYLCDTFKGRCVEFEDWNYRDGDFPKNYIKDITAAIGNYEYVFIGTDPIVLKQLNENGINISLVYPKNELKSEYFKRFVERGSHIDFMNTYNKYWNVWLNELKKQDYCKHIILTKNEYLEDVINNKVRYVMKDVIERLEDAVKKHSSLDDNDLLEVAEHGADTGWDGFTYYADTVKFYDANQYDIWELLERNVDEFGNKNVFELIMTFGGAKDVHSLDQMKNLLSWFALEEVGHFIERKQEYEEQTA